MPRCPRAVRSNYPCGQGLDSLSCVDRRQNEGGIKALAARLGKARYGPPQEQVVQRNAHLAGADVRMSSEHGNVQKDGLLAAFLQDFGDERKCEDALYAARWPDGFECRGCGGGTCCRLRTRQLFQCNSCKNQVSLTAGTLFSWTKLPLTSWFLAIHLIMRSGHRISGAELSRRLGVNQNTALKMKRKILAALQDPQERSALQVLVHGGQTTAS